MTSFRIASWNINSVKAHLPHLLEWLGQAKPDMVLLQETKCLDENFPSMEIEGLGYHCAVTGQKTYNGVAILSRLKPQVAQRLLPGHEENPQARYIEATVTSPAGNVLRAASVYAPNGNPVDSPKYGYKLDWLSRLQEHARDLLDQEEIIVLGGDYNICPQAEDVYDPDAFADDALFRRESRHRFNEIVNLGLTDAIRAFHHGPGLYSYWDYQGGAWVKDHGLRIDHLLLSPQAADRLMKADIDRKPRGADKPSDHTPVWCELDL